MRYALDEVSLTRKEESASIVSFWALRKIIGWYHDWFKKSSDVLDNPTYIASFNTVSKQKPAMQKMKRSISITVGHFRFYEEMRAAAFDHLSSFWIVKFVTNMIESFSEIPILNFKATQQQERKALLLFFSQNLQKRIWHIIQQRISFPNSFGVKNDSRSFQLRNVWSHSRWILQNGFDGLAC